MNTPEKWASDSRLWADQCLINKLKERLDRAKKPEKRQRYVQRIQAAKGRLLAETLLRS